MSRSVCYARGHRVSWRVTLRLQWQSTLCCFLVALGLSGCGEPPEPSVAYTPTATTHEFMVWMLEPAADVLWDSAGYVITEEGEQDLQPTTQEGWNEVRNAATVVAESGNLLMMPGYAIAGDWMEYSQALVAAGITARDAAVAQDADALFEAGARLYNVCRACHNRYINEAGD